MQIVDLGVLLGEERTSADNERPVLETAHSRWTLLRVAAQSRHEVAAEGSNERVLVILGGTGTLHIDDHRTTLLSGHLVTVKPGAAFAIWCEGAQDLELLQMNIACDEETA